MSRAGKSAAALAVLAAVAAVAAQASAGQNAATITISIPASVKGAAPLVLTVPKPPPDTTLGIVTPLHADPGQAAMDTANQRIAKLVGAKFVMEDANLDANKQLQIADSMLSRGYKPIISDILFPHSLDTFLARAKAKNVPTCVEFSTTPGGAQEDDAKAGRRWPRSCTRSSRTGRPAPCWRTPRPR